MPKLKVYTLGYTFPARQILDALGVPSHIRQASVFVVATGKWAAVELAAEAGCGHESATEVRVADEPLAVSLLETVDRPAVFVVPLSYTTGDVVLVADEAGPRRIGMVGRVEGQVGHTLVQDERVEG